MSSQNTNNTYNQLSFALIFDVRKPPCFVPERSKRETIQIAMQTLLSRSDCNNRRPSSLNRISPSFTLGRLSEIIRAARLLSSVDARWRWGCGESLTSSHSPHFCLLFLARLIYGRLKQQQASDIESCYIRMIIASPGTSGQNMNNAISVSAGIRFHYTSYPQLARLAKRRTSSCIRWRQAPTVLSYGSDPFIQHLRQKLKMPLTSGKLNHRSNL